RLLATPSTSACFPSNLPAMRGILLALRTNVPERDGAEQAGGGGVQGCLPPGDTPDMSGDESGALCERFRAPDGLPAGASGLSGGDGWRFSWKMAPWRSRTRCRT